jgi:DNA (cytosine-5)-methyltransferase 1
MTRKKSYITVTDMFCGCGGSTQGAALAGAEVTMAANHWQLAIESHNTNFPETAHDCADVSQVVPRRWPSTDVLWASPECTNHSNAKGKRRRGAQMSLLGGEDPLDPAAVRSRATMWDVPRFAEYHDYRVIVVENVVEARKWRLWPGWLKTMQCLNYEFRVLYLNSMFFGVPQSRDRLYAVFWKKGHSAPDLEFRPRAFCEKCDEEVTAVQSWKRPDYPWGRYDAGDQRRQYVYRCPWCTEVVHPYVSPALVAIDWTDPGIRIGDREELGMQPLKDKTLERIQQGIDKFGDQYLVLETAYGHARNVRARPVDRPMMTQTSRQTLALTMPFLTSVNYFRPNNSVDKPLPTQTSGNQHAITIPPSAVIVLRNGADGQSPVEPLTTITAGGINHGLALPPSSLVVIRQNGRPHSVDGPMPTLVASGVPIGMVRLPWLVLNYSPGYARSIVDTLGSITATDHHSLVQNVPFLMSYYKSSNPRTVDEPVATITPVDRHALVQPQELDIEDCYFRMLKPEEIQRGMAFSDDYVVLGTKREKVKQCGNAVTPPVAEWLFERILQALN